MRLLRFRSLIVPVALAVTVLVAAAQPASPATAPTATCEQIALHLRSGSEDGYRIVLGRVGIPDEEHTSRRASRKPRPRVAVLPPRRARRPRRHLPGHDHRARGVARPRRDLLGQHACRQLAADRVLRSIRLEAVERVCGRVPPPLARGLRAARHPGRRAQHDRPPRHRPGLRRRPLDRRRTTELQTATIRTDLKVCTLAQSAYGKPS